MQTQAQPTRKQNHSMTELFGDVISTYTRQQAIEDGFLIDVSAVAREAGFRWPVAVTRRLWDMIDNPPNRHEDTQGRLWDVVWMAKMAARRSTGQEIRFVVILTRKETKPITDPWSKRYGKLHTAIVKNLTLKAVVSGEGPNGGPCITIMLPDED